MSPRDGNETFGTLVLMDVATASGSGQKGGVHTWVGPLHATKRIGASHADLKHKCGTGRIVEGGRRQNARS